MKLSNEREKLVEGLLQASLDLVKEVENGTRKMMREKLLKALPEKKYSYLDDGSDCQGVNAWNKCLTEVKQIIENELKGGE
jgi:hypothetical protein